MAEVLPLLYLHGLSSSDFGLALEQFLGSDQGLSAATITSLTTQWQDDARAFTNRSLAGSDYVYVWVDGIHLKVRLEADKVCLLVIIGVRADGTKELIALADGFRESSRVVGGPAPRLPASRHGRPGARRRRRRPRVLGHGPGGVPPDTVSSAAGSTRSPTSSTRSQVGPPGREAALGEIWNAEDKTHARAAAQAFAADSAPNGRRPRRRSPTTSKSCWPSTTTRPSTGSISERRIRSSRPSPPSGSGSVSPRAPASAPPVSRWRSS